MSWISRHLVFVGITAVCAALIIVEMWFVLERRRTARLTGERLARAEMAWRTLHEATAPATAETTTKLETELAMVAGELEAWRTRLTSGSALIPVPPASEEPSDPAGAYFDLATYVERMRQQAQRQGVEIKPDERFGFLEYAHAGPGPTEIHAIYHERIALESLLMSLFEAKPRQLLSVQRERRAEGDGGLPERGQATADLRRSDSFEWDLRASVRRTSAVHARGFRISFVSQTVALRHLLSALAGSPLVVRTVEVVPATQVTRANDRSDPESGEALVPESFSRITVTLERVEKVDRATGT